MIIFKEEIETINEIPLADLKARKELKEFKEANNSTVEDLIALGNEIKTEIQTSKTEIISLIEELKNQLTEIKDLLGNSTEE